MSFSDFKSILIQQQTEQLNQNYNLNKSISSIMLEELAVEKLVINYCGFDKFYDGCWVEIEVIRPL